VVTRTAHDQHHKHAAAAAAAAGAAAPRSLAAMALQRRSKFSSVAEAVARLGSKPPFSGFHPEALSAYIEHGTRPCPGTTPPPGGMSILRCISMLFPHSMGVVVLEILQNA
jgi:hypothetical protein